MINNSLKIKLKNWINMGFLILIARILFSMIFINSGIGHITNTGQMAKYAESKNVPAPKATVFITGIMILLGGLSILLGIWVNIGAWLLVIFLVPTAIMMHDFWNVDDPMQRQNEMTHFMKDLALAGAAFLIWYLYSTFGSVPWSLG